MTAFKTLLVGLLALLLFDITYVFLGVWWTAGLAPILFVAWYAIADWIAG
jgi:hypothetical protein